MIKTTRWFFIALLFAGFFVSCNDEGSVGLDLLPNADGIGVFQTDTFTMRSLTIREDSLPSQLPPRFVLGEVMDPLFGKSQASIAYQLRLTNENNDLGQNVSVDSLILSLNMEGYYGDTTETLLIEVFELDAPIFRDSTAYTNRLPAFKPTPLASFQYTPRPSQSIPVNEPRINNSDTTFTYGPVLRIPMNTILATKLVNASGTADLQNNINFLNFFKGVYLRATRVGNGAGSTMYLTGVSARSGLFLYYKANGQRRRFDMLIANESARQNFFAFNYNGTTVGSVLGDSSTSIQETYVQAGGGVKTLLQMPYLRNLIQNHHVAINKVEIEFTQIPNSGDAPFSPPGRMFLLIADSLGKNASVLIPDFVEPYYNGNFSNGKYKFVITRHIQRLLQTNTTDFGLVLLPERSISAVSRVVLGSSNHPLYKPRMVITFTKLK
ncbi:MAG: hypothetical protein C0424_03005 [Sphingobacteriaceae bacterium]|nr:hypothetical protein [Sphingobacteriaceae bacterium]